MKTLTDVASVILIGVCMASAPLVEAAATEEAPSGKSFSSIRQADLVSQSQTGSQPMEGNRVPQEESDFAQAQSSDTVVSYEEYLGRYPDGRYVAQARERRDFLRYRSAVEANTIAAFEDCLRHSGAGVWKQQAWTRLEEMMYRDALRENTASAYATYLRRFDSDQFRAQASDDMPMLMLVNDHVRQMRILHEATYYSEALKVDTIEGYTAFLEQYPEGELASEAVYGLGALLPAETPPHVAVYIVQLYSPNIAVCANAARNLQDLQNLAEPAIPSLVRRLGDRRRLLGNAPPETGQDVIFVSDLAARALAGIGVASEPALLVALRDGDPVVRGHAAEALGMLKTARAVDPLVGLLDDAEAETRRSAAWALGRIADRRSVEPLIAALGDKDAGVTINAIQALAAIKDPRSVDPMVNALLTNNIWVAENAMLGLMEFDVQQVRQSLLKAHAADQSRIFQNMIRTNLIAMHRQEPRWRQWWDQLDVYAMHTSAE